MAVSLTDEIMVDSWGMRAAGEARGHVHEPYNQICYACTACDYSDTSSELGGSFACHAGAGGNYKKALRERTFMHVSDQPS